MDNKLKLWDAHSSWEEAEKAWEANARNCAHSHPLKGLSYVPPMLPMTKKTASYLKWKSLKYLIAHDKERILPRHFFKYPIKYAVAFLKSSLKKKSYQREGDFFLYGLPNTETFASLLSDPTSLLVVGFSYCHKPHECPSGRFTTNCIHDPTHPVCGQCFIGKAVHALPEKNVLPLFITTIHYIGGKIFEIVHANPGKKVLFLITACEMTLEMFGDWGNMVGIQGIGVRLEGRICNTMKAFELSEKGIKPGLTIVSPETQKQILSLIKQRRTPK